MTLCPSKKCFRHGNCHARLVFFKGNRLKYSACCCFQFLYGKKNTFQKRNWEVVFVKRYERGERIGAEIIRQFSQKKASKRIVSCEASSKFHRRSFQNERFARCFLQNSQNKLSKRAFRAMLPTILQEKASKMIVSCEASSKFHRTSFQNERFARCFRQFSRKICVSLQFRAIDTPLPARGFIRQKQNVPRTTTPCIPKFQNVRFATAACTKMYESIHREPTRFAHTKMWGFTTVLGDRHHVFSERVDREQMKFAFRYSFGRSTPRF